MPKEKTARKTAISPINGAEIPIGAHPGNTGGKKGRSGRKSQKFGLFLKELRESVDAQSAFKLAALDPKNRNFGNAWKLAADYDEEKPVAKTGLQGDVTIMVKFARE